MEENLQWFENIQSAPVQEQGQRERMPLKKRSSKGGTNQQSQHLQKKESHDGGFMGRRMG